MKKNINIYEVKLPIKSDFGDLEKQLLILSKEEINTYYSYRVDHKKIEFLAGRLLLRKLIGQRLKINPSTIKFNKNKYGKIF